MISRETLEGALNQIIGEKTVQAMRVAGCSATPELVNKAAIDLFPNPSGYPPEIQQVIREAVLSLRTQGFLSYKD